MQLSSPRSYVQVGVVGAVVFVVAVAAALDTAAAAAGLCSGDGTLCELAYEPHEGLPRNMQCMMRCQQSNVRCHSERTASW